MYFVSDVDYLANKPILFNVRSPVDVLKLKKPSLLEILYVVVTLSKS